MLQIIYFDSILTAPQQVVCDALDFAGLDFEPACMNESRKPPNPSPKIALPERMRQLIFDDTRATVEGLRALGLDPPAAWDVPPVAGRHAGGAS